MDGLVSVLICTRNRPDDVGRAVASLLASEGVDIELIVIDQSDGPESAQILEGLVDEGKLRYLRSRTRGLGAALDEGIRLARSFCVVHTDDDCVAPPDWVAGMSNILASHPKVGLVFCNVVAAPFDRTQGYVPAYVQQRERLIRSVFSTCRGRGLGAGMAFRRDAVIKVGGVDTMMGAGSKFQSCEDWDIELRMLLRGWEVLHSPELSVVHYGFRAFSEGREHAARDWLGIGAGLAKLVKAGHASALVLSAWQLGAHGVLPPIVDVLHLRRPRGLQRIVSFCRGFIAGLLAPVDRKTMLFVAATST